MTKEQIKQFRLLNFPGKDSRRQWAKVSGVSERSIRHYECSGIIPKWYPTHINWWCELNDRMIHNDSGMTPWLQELVK